MHVTQDDEARLAVENNATAVWLIVGLLILGSLGGVGVVSYLTGVVDPFQVMMAGLFLAVVVPLLVGASPSVALSFEHGSKEVRIRRSWRLFSTEQAIAYSAFERVEAEKRYGQYGMISYGLAMRLRNGRTVWLGQVTWADEKEIRALAARMNTVLGIAPRKKRRKGTARDLG